MRKTAVVLIALFLSATPAFAKVKVVATLQWIGSVAGEIGKGQVEVATLVKPNQDPHMVEARPSMILAARKADILMYNGLDLEIGYLPVLIESSRNPNIQPGKPGNFDCSHFVTVMEKPVSVDRSMGDVHPLGNPHYHYSPGRILSVAEGMADALSTIDPSHADAYKANLSIFREKVRAKQKEWSALPTKGRRFIAYHKLFEYLAADFGFTITAYVEPKPGIPPSAGYIERLIGTIRETRPDGILLTPYYGRREADFLTRRTGVPTIVVPHDVGAVPGANDWFSFMDQALSALVK
ncbi:metal ABC transporter substrate-binding protein [Candidatus Deferrimicrobium sp.]|uniref:metal ABC transporter substrate-binding protein n=1 Tax=Candidatus Deferrimicrobium sp. TaxID=3060586 RepID=UPI003C3587DB